MWWTKVLHMLWRNGNVAKPAREIKLLLFLFFCHQPPTYLIYATCFQTSAAHIANKFSCTFSSPCHQKLTRNHATNSIKLGSEQQLCWKLRFAFAHSSDVPFTYCTINAKWLPVRSIAYFVSTISGRHLYEPMHKYLLDETDIDSSNSISNHLLYHLMSMRLWLFYAVPEFLYAICITFNNNWISNTRIHYLKWYAVRCVVCAHNRRLN